MNTDTIPVLSTISPFEVARTIARGACLALGDETMHWVIQEAVDSLKRDRKPVTKAGVLAVIDHLEVVYTA